MTALHRDCPACMAAALDVPCPICAAAPNDPCRNPFDDGRRIVHPPHWARALAAKEGNNQ